MQAKVSNFCFKGKDETLTKEREINRKKEKAKKHEVR